MDKFVTVLCLLVFTSQCVFTYDDDNEQHTIGGLFYEDEAEDLIAALSVSAEMYNFKTAVKIVSKRREILEISQHICELAQEKVIGIIDGTGGRSTEHVQSLCDLLELPHIIIQPSDLFAKNWSALNLYPSPEAYNNVLTSLITLKDWNNFTILYESGFSLIHVERLMQMGNDTDKSTISVRELQGNDYRDVLIDAKKNGYFNFVVDCPSKKLEQFLLHALQVGVMADEHSYIFLSPDLFSLDLNPYRFGGVNMTGFRLFNLKENTVVWEFTYKLANFTGKELEASQLKTKVVLVHDAVKVFNETVKKVNYTMAAELNCDNYDAWTHGSTLLNFMKTNKIEGATSTLMFDGFGQRNSVYFDVVELTPAGNQTIGLWKLNDYEITRPLTKSPEYSEDSPLKNKTLKVLIAITPPYAYIKESAMKLEGNDQFEGFAIDLINELSKILGFNYEFEIEDDYGGFNETTLKATGMVAQLREKKAELAICDLTITEERQKGIDFSTPFMTLGIGILYKEPRKQPPEMFSFMAVFSNEVWYYMLFVQLGVGCIMIFVGRISHKEWQNPVPCIEQPEELSNQFSFANSIWLIIGSVMQQGSEIAPIALAPRMITSAWWFFTMVIVASYVGTLVAFLTVEKNVLPFRTLEELDAQKSINYGCKGKGSTIGFFKESHIPLNQKMFKQMQLKKSFVSSNDEGVALAENSTYAFFTESTAIEYYRARHCDLLQIGELLDSKSYGIGMKPNSEYKKYIDYALLKLKEQGELQKLRNLWWQEKRGGGKCGVKKEEDAKQLGMKNMLGAFVVLGVGCVIGIFISILDMLWGVFKRSVKYNTTFKYELVEELKFALTFSGDVKPVKRPSKTDEGSEEALAEAEALAKDEAKDELASLKSARTMRSARSTSTRRSTHSHCSRHSPSELSVAFARRREYS